MEISRIFSFVVGGGPDSGLATLCPVSNYEVKAISLIR